MHPQLAVVQGIVTDVEAHPELEVTSQPPLIGSPLSPPLGLPQMG